MATPKKPTKELANENKKKQQVLRTAGYNIKVDGSWGPWLEKQYRKVTSAKGGKTSLANVGVMALPVAGYGIALLLEGLGSMSPPSISLPSISAPAAAMAAPVALTLAGPAYGLYETITGQHHLANITPQERLAMTYAPDATRVSRPIVISRTRVGSLSQSRPMGEMYINPALTRTRSVSMASEAPTDPIPPSPEANTLNTSSSAGTPNNGNGNSEKPKKPLRDNRYKKTLQEAGEYWKNVGNKALKYTLRTAPWLGAVGYGAYRGVLIANPSLTPTAADSLLEEQSRQIMELGKLDRAKQNQITIDSLRRSLSNPVRSTGQNPLQISPEDSVRNAALKRYLDDILHGKN